MGFEKIIDCSIEFSLRRSQDIKAVSIVDIIVGSTPHSCIQMACHIGHEVIRKEVNMGPGNIWPCKEFLGQIPDITTCRGNSRKEEKLEWRKHIYNTHDYFSFYGQKMQIQTVKSIVAIQLSWLTLYGLGEELMFLNSNLTLYIALKILLHSFSIC